MKKFFRNLHIWLSIPFGLIIVIICFTGAALVFEDEITEMCRHDLYYVDKVEAQALPVPQLMEKVAATLPDSVTVTGVTIAADPERAYRVNLSKPRRASIFIDQYTGEVKGKYERAPFFTFMFKMHRSLLGNMKPAAGEISVGKLVVGVSTLLMVAILISGLIVWIPRSSKVVKNRLKICVSKGWRRFWYDLHVSGGIYTTIFLLVLALTGLTWSFSWYRSAFYQVFGAEVKQQTSHVGGQQEHSERKVHGKNKNHSDPGSHEGNKDNHQEHPKQDGARGGSTAEHTRGFLHAEDEHFVYWQNVYEQLKKQNPAYKQISIANGTASVSFDGFGNQRATDRYTFETSSGEISETNLYVNQDKAGKLRGWIYSVHVGNWGGLLTQILTFLAALLGTTLPITGFYLWIKRWKQKQKRINNC